MSQPHPPDDRLLACGELVPAHLRPVLAALLSGATDAAAAHWINISQRTYSRRLAELLDLFESQTRFQAGVKVGLSGSIAAVRGHQARELLRAPTGPFVDLDGAVDDRRGGSDAGATAIVISHQ